MGVIFAIFQMRDAARTRHTGLIIQLNPALKVTMSEVIAHALKLVVPGLSIKVGDMKGPIVDGELLKCKDFGKKIADQLKT